MNLICGINPVLEALAAGTRHFDRLLVVKGLRNRRLADAIARATRLGIPLRFEMRETLDRLAGGVPHQGVIAVVSAKPVLTLEQLLEEASDPALLVVLDGVEDPRNLGAILRSVEAAGADGALLPERHSAGLSEIVGRASAGAMEHVRVAQVGNLVQALETLKSRGVWVVGFDASGRERWDAVDLKQSVCLVLGGEGQGIRRLVREHCDHLVSIPHFGHVSSLNVSVAAGIALYEAVRQRGTVPSRSDRFPRLPPPPRGRRAHARRRGERSRRARILLGVPPRGRRRGRPETLPSHVDIHGEEVAWGQGPPFSSPSTRDGDAGPRAARGGSTLRRRGRQGRRGGRRRRRGATAAARRARSQMAPSSRRKCPTARPRTKPRTPPRPRTPQPGAAAATRRGSDPGRPLPLVQSPPTRAPTRRPRRAEGPRTSPGDGAAVGVGGAAAVAPLPASWHPACVTSERLLNFPFVAGVAQR